MTLSFSSAERAFDALQHYQMTLDAGDRDHRRTSGHRVVAASGVAFMNA